MQIGVDSLSRPVELHRPRNQRKAFELGRQSKTSPQDIEWPRSASESGGKSSTLTLLLQCLNFIRSAAKDGWFRPVMATCASSAMKSRAVARSMPLLPPVMRAFLPVSFIMLLF